MERGLVDVTAAASLDYSGGGLRTNRLVSARLRFHRGDVEFLKDTRFSEAQRIPKLDRYRRQDNVPYRQQVMWQRTMEAIEDAFEAVNARIDEVAILARISGVEQLAAAANDNAVKAKAENEALAEAVKGTFQQLDPVYSEGFEQSYEDGLDNP